jgi:hypothetical protein
MRIIIFGSRNWNQYGHIHERIWALPDGCIIVHGACNTGADEMADRVARARGFKVERHPAVWRPRGQAGPVDYAAGPTRNANMARLGAALAIGFRMPGKSNGTDNMRDEAELRGIPVERHGWGWRETAWHGVRA